MDRDTFDSTVRIFKNQEPFRAFTISLVNGERVGVDHPDALVCETGWACSLDRAVFPRCSTMRGLLK